MIKLVRDMCIDDRAHSVHFKLKFAVLDLMFDSNGNVRFHCTKQLKNKSELYCYRVIVKCDFTFISIFTITTPTLITLNYVFIN